MSSIFGPSFWPQAGDSVPLFSVPGNHGANATFFTNWPQAQAVANSSGKYADGDVLLCEQLQVGESPSTWYAFNEGNARFYVLTAQWSDSNVGNTTPYGMDYAYRWQQNSAEYQWLQNDLQTHPSQLKFAIWHYPLYVDNATEPSDTFLQGPNSLEGLLDRQRREHGLQRARAPVRAEQPDERRVGQLRHRGRRGEARADLALQAVRRLRASAGARRGGSKCGTAVKPTRDRSGVPLPAGRRERRNR